MPQKGPSKANKTKDKAEHRALAEGEAREIPTRVSDLQVTELELVGAPIPLHLKEKQPLVIIMV